jgi:DNA modification methylase
MPKLVWDSKKYPAPLPTRLKVESIHYPGGKGYPEVEPQNRLILGDNLSVLSALLPEWEGKIQLIYADPPFFTNRQFPTRIGHGEDSRRPQDWQLAEGYPDDWPDLDAYLDMLYPRLVLMYRLLAPTGTLYLHLDWHANAYARILLDEIFGQDRLLNEIIWAYHGPSPIRSAFNRKHDTIYAYTKSDAYLFNADAVRQPYHPNTVKTFESSPRAGFGKVPDLQRGKVPEDWWYFPVVARLHTERTGYPTQKPASLLERIILASSNAGDMVADFFCGSGTTALVAGRSGRRFIGNDISWRAIHTCLARLCHSQEQPFSFQTLQDKPLRFQPFPFEGPVAVHQAERLVCQLLHPEQVEYWEVDPAWDGQVFRSFAQASRPRSHHPLIDRLELPETGNSLPVCVHAINHAGELFQAVLQRPGN